MLVVDEVMMPDKLEQYLITEHSEYQNDRERDHGNISPPLGSRAGIIVSFPDLTIHF